MCKPVILLCVLLCDLRVSNKFTVNINYKINNFKRFILLRKIQAEKVSLMKSM